MKGYVLLLGQGLEEATVHSLQSLALLPAGYVKGKAPGGGRAICEKEQTLSAITMGTVVHNLHPCSGPLHE